jgi:ATP-binding cassette subfamily B protein
MWRRYACVRQHDQSDCGAAALATIALHHRKPVGLLQLRDLAGTDRVGANLLGLVAAAERLGFSARAVKGPFAALAEVPLPAVAHVKNEEGLGHFVVLHRVTSRRVILADPGHGVESISHDQFRARWTGYVLLMVPEAGQPKSSPGEQPRRPWRRFVALLLAQRSFLFEAGACALLVTLLGLSTSYFVQHLVDSVLARGETQLLNALGAGMLLVMAFRSLFDVVRKYLLAYVSRKIDLSLVSNYATHVLNLPLAFFETRRVGEIISRVHDAAKVRQAIGATTLSAVVDGVLVLLSLTVLWLYDLPLALVATLFLPLLAIGITAHVPAAKRKSRLAMEQASQLTAHLVEDASGIETVKAYGLERERSREAEQRLVDVVQSAFKLQLLGVSMSALGAFLTGIAGVVVLWYGGHRVVRGALSIGELMFFYTLLGHMLAPVERLTMLNFSLQDALVALDRLAQVMDLEVEQPRRHKKATCPGFRDGIELDQVSFQYGCRDEVLRKISMKIPAGSTIAIVGGSGSGKSTLLKLLMGFYTPTAGRILVDGIDARDIDLSSLRSHIGLVSQDPFIFTGTILDNIAAARPTASMKEVVAAARTAGLDGFIRNLPERYETVIGERGANLSGGERQRLAIARSLLRRPDVLIFDEATSHLDTTTERAIQESMQATLHKRTAIVVAHRLSTVRTADRIFVLHEGRIAEQGRHYELLGLRGHYDRLWQAQTAGWGSEHRENHGVTRINGRVPHLVR